MIVGELAVDLGYEISKVSPKFYMQNENIIGSAPSHSGLTILPCVHGTPAFATKISNRPLKSRAMSLMAFLVSSKSVTST